MSFHGEIVEWSLDALGWLAGFLSDVAAVRGVTASLLITVVKSPAAR
jgi:hypothetical protein